MKKWIFGGLAALLLAGLAWAQSPGQIRLSSLVGPIGIAAQTSGPQSAYIPLNGGTFTCAGGTATVTNTNVDAGSVIVMTLKTAAGTVAAPFVATITAATGFTVTCGGSDTSIYNYIILG